jgi:hypothetical protein
MLDGYHPGDPVVRVFAYQARPGRPAEEIAEEAFAIFNDHPRDAAEVELACAYYGRRLRSLSFLGNSPSCSRSCYSDRRVVLPGCIEVAGQGCAIWAPERARALLPVPSPV